MARARCVEPRDAGSLYAPGSTFKIVTLATALEDGVADEDTVFSSPGTMEIGNAPVTNFNKANYGEPHAWPAQPSFPSNTVFGQLGVEMGADKLVAGAEKLRLQQGDRLRAVHARITHALEPDETCTRVPGSWHGRPPASRWETPRAPAARARPAPRPPCCEMAMVGTAIANDGVIMQPYLVDSVNNANGERSFIGLAERN